MQLGTGLREYPGSLRVVDDKLPTPVYSCEMIFRNYIVLAFVSLLTLPGCSQEAPETQAPLAITEDCNAYTGWEAVVAKAQTHIIVFGEMHGTTQSPEAVRGLVCEMLKSGITVLLGLEAEHWQGEALNAALSNPIDSSVLLAAAPKMWGVHYGRSSEATLSLLEDIARWRSNDLPISMFAFDAEPDEWVSAENGAVARDAAMAIHIDRATENFDGAIILLTGEFHARKQLIHFGDQTYVPMATKITVRSVFALEMKYGPGEAWVQGSVDGGEVTIGPMKLGGNEGTEAPVRTFIMDGKNENYDGYYYTGPITPSPPAFPGAEIP